MTFVGSALGKKTKTKLPPERSYGGEMNQALTAQREIAPGVLAAEGDYRSQFADLDLNTLQQVLPALMDHYRRLGGQEMANNQGNAYSAFDIGNRLSGGLQGQLTRDAGTALASGSQLTPAELRMLREGVYGQRAAMGWGKGPADGAYAALAELSAGQQNLARNRAYAQSVAGQNYGASAPWLGAGSASARALLQYGDAFGRNIGPRIFNPESQYNADLNNQKYQTTFAKNAADQANRTALITAGMAADAQVASSAMSAGGGCWVAREVFGASNPLWLCFRHWLFHQAPRWFRSLYLRHGEAFAAWIHDKPRLKAVIRRWMLTRIATLQPH